jgi:hypothetical protein
MQALNCRGDQVGVINAFEALKKDVDLVPIAKAHKQAIYSLVLAAYAATAEARPQTLPFDREELDRLAREMRDTGCSADSVNLGYCYLLSKEFHIAHDYFVGGLKTGDRSLTGRSCAGCSATNISLKDIALTALCQIADDQNFDSEKKSDSAWATLVELAQARDGLNTDDLPAMLQVVKADPLISGGLLRDSRVTNEALTRLIQIVSTHKFVIELRHVDVNGNKFAIGTVVPVDLQDPRPKALGVINAVYTVPPPPMTPAEPKPTNPPTQPKAEPPKIQIPPLETEPPPLARKE